MKISLTQKIFDALNNWRLIPTEWAKKWYKYNLLIRDLIWARNIFDWYIIDVYDLENNFLETVKIETKPVIEFWCVHNKLFLLN
jgi:hypothetical protein